MRDVVLSHRIPLVHSRVVSDPPFIVRSICACLVELFFCTGLCNSPVLFLMWPSYLGDCRLCFPVFGVGHHDHHHRVAFASPCSLWAITIMTIASSSSFPSRCRRCRRHCCAPVRAVGTPCEFAMCLTRRCVALVLAAFDVVRISLCVNFSRKASSAAGAAQGRMDSTGACAQYEKGRSSAL